MTIKKFQYQQRDASSNRKRAEQWSNERQSYLSDHVKMWKPKEGANIIRILPPSWPKADHFGLDIYVHFSVGADGGAFLDLKKMKNEPDPIAEEVAMLRAAGEEDAAKTLDSKKRVLVYLIDRENERDGVMMWAMPWTVDRDIAVAAKNPRSKNPLFIDDPDKGYDLIINRTGTKRQTEYQVQIDRESSPLDLTDEMIDLLETRPLPNCLIFATYEQKESAFKSGVKKPDDDKAGKSAKTSRKTTMKFDVNTITYADIEELSGSGLDDLVEQLLSEGYEVDEHAQNDEQLKESIYTALDIQKPRATRPTRKPVEPAPKPETRPSSRHTMREEGDQDENEDEPSPSEVAPSNSELKERLAKLRAQRNAEA